MIGRREANKASKRRRLFEAGVHLFSEVGYGVASIEKLAPLADISRGTFYLYYPGKLELFQDIAQRWLKGLAMDIEAATSLEELEAAFVDSARHVPDVALLVLQELRAPGDAGAWLREEEARWLEVAGRHLGDRATRWLGGIELDLACRLSVTARRSTTAIGVP